MSHYQHVIAKPQHVHGPECDTPDGYRLWILKLSVQFGVKPVVFNGRSQLRKGHKKLHAYVSDGRWAAQCPCGNGIAVHPEWGFGCCVECGTEWQVVVHDDWQKAEALLLERHNKRDWFPHKDTAQMHGVANAETVSVLELENVAYLDE